MSASRFRLLDQISLALERGNGEATQRVSGQTIEGLGPVIEAVILGRTVPGAKSILPLCALKEIVGAVKSAKHDPLRVVCKEKGATSWGVLMLTKASRDDWVPPLHSLLFTVQKSLNFSRKTSRARQQICGAVEEMVDNIYEHSEAPDTGVVAFYGSANHVEVSVGDAGIGVLSSLRSNPKFSYLRDTGTAMAEALKDGNSRYGPGEDRGYGFGTLFRALNSLDAELRFRSGDYALEISGRSPSDRNPRISQKGELRGFVVCLQIAL